MISSKVLAGTMTVSFLLLGWLQPRYVLLDMPFGLAFYVTDLLGLWEPGILWAPTHRALAITCFIVWPIVVSAAFGYAVLWLAVRISAGQSKWSRYYALAFVAWVFGMIVSVRVEPGSYFVSLWGYVTANY